MLTKHCPMCDQTKPLSEFSPSSRHLCGWKPRCKSCLNIVKRGQMDRLKEKMRLLTEAATQKEFNSVTARDYSNYLQPYVPEKAHHRNDGNKEIKSRGTLC